MVVVVIIAILVGLAVPALGGAILAAQRAECAGNMRQIGMAMLMYAGENNNRLPKTSFGNTLGDTWIDSIAPYLNDVDEVRICPADPLGEERLAAGGTSYIVNSFLFIPPTDNRGRPKGPPPTLLQIEKPSSTMMAFIVSEDQSEGLSSDHTHSHGWTNDWAAVTDDISPDRFTRSPVSDHSRGTSNYLYADGHVEAIKAEEIKSRVEAGDNIALPR